MSKNAAGEDYLGGLHQVLAKRLLEALEHNGRTLFDEDGEAVLFKVDPRIMSSAVTFLKNNKIQARPFIEETVSEIEQKLQKRKKKFSNVTPLDAAKRAADNA